MNMLDLAPGDRQPVEYLSDLFAVIVSIEEMEKASRRDVITQEQYLSTVKRLYTRYKNLVAQLENGRNPYFTNIDDFLDTYCSRCAGARATLKEGPITDASEDTGRFFTRHSVACTEYFITLLDALGLQQVAIDQLYPLLQELLLGLGKLKVEGRDFYKKLEKWREYMSDKNAADTLNAEEVRQLTFDLQSSYKDFCTFVGDDGASARRA